MRLRPKPYEAPWHTTTRSIAFGLIALSFASWLTAFAVNSFAHPWFMGVLALAFLVFGLSGALASIVYCVGLAPGFAAWAARSIRQRIGTRREEQDQDSR